MRHFNSSHSKSLFYYVVGSFFKSFFASRIDDHEPPYNPRYSNKISNNNTNIIMSQQQQQNNGDGAVAPRPLQMGAKGAYIVRLLMVGDSSCGKTSLVLRFDQNVFSTKFVTTIGVDYRDKMVKVNLDQFRY